jgi:hypothetical protein
VAEQRERLATPRRSTKAWLRSNVSTVLRAYHNWLTLLKRNGQKGFLSHLSRSNVTINFDSALRSIMTNKKELQKIEPDTTVEVKKAEVRWFQSHVSNMKMWRPRSTSPARDQQVHVQRMLT